MCFHKRHSFQQNSIFQQKTICWKVFDQLAWEISYLISGSISQQWLRICSVNCSGAPQLHSTYTHTVKPQMCECSPAEMLIPVLACRSETKLSSENFELCCKFHLDFWESTNTGHDLWHCGLCRLVLNEWAVSLLLFTAERQLWRFLSKGLLSKSIFTNHHHAFLFLRCKRTLKWRSGWKELEMKSDLT